MASFDTFLNSFDPDSLTRGKQFERFVKWFLKNDPEWITQIDKVWLWDEYPDRWGPDCGIDLVFRHKNGEIWSLWVLGIMILKIIRDLSSLYTFINIII